MKASTTSYPSIEAVTAVMKLAEKIFVDDGCIRLGIFFAALARGSTGYKYGSYVSAHWKDFRGIGTADLRELYEFTLLMLERKHGPLICRATDRPANDKEHWGFADKFCTHCSRAYEGTGPAWGEVRVRRIAALKAGHPDANTRLFLGVMPNTEWMKLEHPLAQAA